MTLNEILETAGCEALNDFLMLNFARTLEDVLTAALDLTETLKNSEESDAEVDAEAQLDLLCSSVISAPRMFRRPASDSNQTPLSMTTVGSCRNLLSESVTGAIWQTVEEYQSKGKRYYRYRYGCSHSVQGSRHIRGGQISSREAIARASRVRRMIREGRSPQEILAIL